MPFEGDRCLYTAILSTVPDMATECAAGLV